MVNDINGEVHEIASTIVGTDIVFRKGTSLIFFINASSMFKKPGRDRTGSLADVKFVTNFTGNFINEKTDITVKIIR